MTVVDELLNEIGAILGPSVTPNLTSASNASDVFEAYVLSLVVEAAQTEGAIITYRDVLGNASNVFVFRTSPGYIFSSNRPYTHAELTFPGRPPLEAHVGVRVAGKSQVLHEADVAVIEHAEAETCRLRGVPPRSSKLVLAIECKFYSTPLHLHLAREFIGLTADLSAGSSIFVTNSGSSSLERLLTARNRDWEHNLSPTMSNEVSRLRHRIQDAFKRFKAV
jgi:hypothetical protein